MTGAAGRNRTPAGRDRWASPRRVSSGDAAGDRHRQLEHHDRPRSRTACSSRPAGRRRTGRPRPMSSSSCSRACSASTRSTCGGIAAIACASVVPSLTAALEAIARAARPGPRAGHRGPRAPADPGRPPRRGRRGPARERPGGRPAVRRAGRGRRPGHRDDVRRRRGRRGFLGGAIAPGLEIGLDALAARTAKLPRIELRQPDRAIARDTVGALQAGRDPRLPGARQPASLPGSGGSWPTPPESTRGRDQRS